MIYTFSYYGDIVGKQRHRTTKSGHTYTPKKTVEFEKGIKDAFISYYPDQKPLSGAISLKVIIGIVPPKSWPKWKREHVCDNAYPHTSKPDADNILKSVKDALNNELYIDDSQVYNVTAVKVYGPISRVFVRAEQIREIPAKDLINNFSYDDEM